MNRLRTYWRSLAGRLRSFFRRRRQKAFRKGKAATPTAICVPVYGEGEIGEGGRTLLLQFPILNEEADRAIYGTDPYTIDLITQNRPDYIIRGLN